MLDFTEPELAFVEDYGPAARGGGLVTEVLTEDFWHEGLELTSPAGEGVKMALLLVGAKGRLRKNWVVVPERRHSLR